MKKRVLVINLGWEQEPLIERLSSREDLELYGVHYDENYLRSAEWKDLLICDLRDLPRIISFADRIKPQAVISDQCDYSYFAQAVIAERFGLPGPRVAEAQVATNKYLQRLRAREAGLPVPEFRLCRSLDEARQALREVGLPAVVKPVDNRGSFGVNRIENEGELSDAFYEALAHSHSRFVLVEEFVEGIHITVDGYVFAERGPTSLALATKVMLGGRRQVAMEIVYPGYLSDDLYEAALKLNEKVNRALGFRFGMLHSEYMVHPERERIVLIETANRGGGVYTSEVIVPAVSGVDLVGCYIADTLGKERPSLVGPVEKNGVCLKFFELPPGRLEAIKGLEKWEEDPRVLRFRFLVRPGEYIQDITTDANRHGFVIFRFEEDPSETFHELMEGLEIILT